MASSVQRVALAGAAASPVVSRWSRADTPIRLRGTALFVVGWLLVAGTTMIFAASVRGDALADARNRAGEVVIEAQLVRSKVSSADAAAAASVFAHVAQTDPVHDTPEEKRAAYGTAADRSTTNGDITAAAAGVVEMRQLGVEGCPTSGPSVRGECAGTLLKTLGELIPQYVGLVNTAQAYVRTGSSTAEAYLRRASDLARQEIIPRVDSLIGIAGNEVDADFRTATDGRVDLLLVVLVAGGGTVLLGLQVYYSRRSRRVFEIRLVAATGCVLAAASLFGASALLQESRASSSVNEGYVPMTTLSQARVFASQARADENLAVLSLGVNDDSEDDWNNSLADLGEAMTVEELPAETVSQIRSNIARWQRNHDEVTRALSGTGTEFLRAARLTVGEGAAAFADLDNSFETAVSASTGRFQAHMAAAKSPVPTALGWAAGCMLFLAAILVHMGMRHRLQTYRFQR
ncbi:MULTISPECIES: hypothetical protein [Parafrankia]|uniref:hypothetical protein n=1 Tax=Parafrankia TaxID=2994362 RepID=UPI001D014B3A|nr:MULTISPECIES: hypothetical protein [Parafrankia]